MWLNLKPLYFHLIFRLLKMYVLYWNVRRHCGLSKHMWSPFHRSPVGLPFQRMTRRGENSPFIGSIFLVLLGTKVVVILRWSLFWGGLKFDILYYICATKIYLPRPMRKEVNNWNSVSRSTVLEAFSAPLWGLPLISDPVENTHQVHIPFSHHRTQNCGWFPIAMVTHALLPREPWFMEI